MVQMEMKKGKVLCQKLLGRQEGAGRVQSSNSHPQDGKEKWTSVCTLIPILLFFQSNKTQMVTQNKNYISQAPLQLGMVIWLRSTHGDVSRNGEGRVLKGRVCDFPPSSYSWLDYGLDGWSWSIHFGLWQYAEESRAGRLNKPEPLTLWHPIVNPRLTTSGFLLPERQINVHLV